VTVKITSVKAEERFDNIEFSNAVADSTALSIYTAYTCPCGTRTGFQKHDFERHMRQPFSNIAPEIAKCFDEFAQEHLGRIIDYLDWACPSCRAPARVYFQFWAGGKHGDSGFHLHTVVEAAPAPTSAD
jgi:hypothetical protein